MKKFLYLICKKSSILAIVLVLMFASCGEDILKEVPLDFLAPENAYLTEEGIKQGIGSLHNEVRMAFFSFSRFTTMLTWRGLGVDLGYFGEDPATNRYLVNYPTYLTPASAEVADTWNTGYRIIQWANLLIEKINETDETVFRSEADKNVYLAEAMFFRAYAYRNLVSTFGDIPLVTEPTKSAKVDFRRDPKADIYKLMEDDLKFGTTNLPEPGEEDAPGRITQGAAWHYLAETYLEQGKYQLAVEAASQVIDGYNYALMTERFGTRLGNDVFGTGDVYYDLFGYDNHNLPENTEGIWVIQFEPYITGGASQGSAYIFGPAYFRLGNTPDGYKAILGIMFEGKYTGYTDTLSRPVATMRGTSYVYYNIWRSDWNNDIRNAEHNLKRNFYYDNPESAYHGQKIDFSLYPPGTRDPIRDTCQYIFPCHMKFHDPCHYFEQPHRAGGGQTHKDAYALRLPETLLIRAEAYLGLNNQVAAAADINTIRIRANANPVAPEDVTYDYILDEQTRELFGESWRHITLRRMGKLVERTRMYNDNPKIPGLNIQDHNVLWPIPQAQIDLNIGAEFPQNPGY